MKQIATRMWFEDTGLPGRRVALSFGVHGNERAPIDAGELLLEALEAGEVRLATGSLLLLHGNPKATEEDQRATEGGVDLNRCFHSSVLGRAPELYEERRAAEIVAALERYRIEALVDFHCTVEPGERFLMQHPPVTDAAHMEVVDLLQAGVLLTDPGMEFGGVSLDEWMSTRDRVGICYETGWIGDPENTPEVTLEEMKNVLRGLGVLTDGAAKTFGEKTLLEMTAPLLCEQEGFQWREGVGENLQALPAGTLLGSYGDGSEVVLENDSTLVFPKKRPEMVQLQKPLVYLSQRKG